MIERFADGEALAAAAARHVTGQLAAGLAARGRAVLVGTGGRSPGPVYDRLAGAGLDWSKVTVTLSDERCVDEDSPQSNLRLLRQRLLREGAASARALPLWPPPPDEALRALLPFDVVMLGMGEDGHIASLIPGAPNLAEGLDVDGARLTIMTPEGLGSPAVARISLTLAALAQARSVLVLVAGDTKRRVVEAALAGGDLPVRALLMQSRAPVRVLWSPNQEV